MGVSSRRFTRPPVLAPSYLSLGRERCWVLRHPRPRRWARGTKEVRAVGGACAEGAQEAVGELTSWAGEPGFLRELLAAP